MDEEICCLLFLMKELIRPHPSITAPTRGWPTEGQLTAGGTPAAEEVPILSNKQSPHFDLKWNREDLRQAGEDTRLGTSVLWRSSRVLLVAACRLSCSRLEMFSLSIKPVLPY